MDSQPDRQFRALQVAIGLAATIAGLDKFFNILADWPSYISPAAAHFLPISVGAFMHLVGVVEVAVGAALLTVAPRKGAYAAGAWLLLVALNLVVAGRFDVAVRDLVIAIAAFTMARAGVLERARTSDADTPQRTRRTITA